MATRIKISSICYTPNANEESLHTLAFDVSDDTSIRFLALKVIDDAIKNGLTEYPLFMQSDFPISIWLAGDARSDHYGTRYGINHDGSIKYLKDFEPLTHEFTYSELKTLHTEGIIDGNIKHLTILAGEGLGAGWPDVVGHIADIFGVIAGVAWSTGIIKTKIKRSEIKRLVEYLEENNLTDPAKIRAIIDKKSTWNQHSISKLLHTTDEMSVALLAMLGYSLVGNTWKLSQNKQSMENRTKWLEYEEKFSKRQDRKLKRNQLFWRFGRIK